MFFYQFLIILQIIISEMFERSVGFVLRFASVLWGLIEEKKSY